MGIAGRLALLVTVTAAVAARAPAAAAQPDPGGERPWAEGVAEADQTEALRLFREGNELFAHSEYAEAAKRYRAALARWDHPAIHGNLAVALIHLDEPLEAFEHVEAALRHGPAPFEAHVYEQLVTSRKLLLGQLATIEVACGVAGAEISLDGALLLTGAGRAERRVRVGPHQVVARKAGHLTFAQRFTALPGRPVHIEVVLVPLDQAGGYERRWAEWKPWAVLGGGLAIAAIGVPLQLSAQSNIDDYEQEIARSCETGCEPGELPEAVRDLEARGRLHNRLAVGAFLIGGAAAATGGVLLYLNRPRRVRLEESGRRIGAAPLLGPDLAGVALTLEY